jgi:hypothetical protein
LTFSAGCDTLLAFVLQRKKKESSSLMIFLHFFHHPDSSFFPSGSDRAATPYLRFGPISFSTPIVPGEALPPVSKSRDGFSDDPGEVKSLDEGCPLLGILLGCFVSAVMWTALITALCYFLE